MKELQKELKNRRAEKKKLADSLVEIMKEMRLIAGFIGRLYIQKQRSKQL